MLALVMVLSLAACGEKKPKEVPFTVDVSALEAYGSDGLGLKLPAGMDSDKLDGFDLFLFNDEMMLVAVKDGKEELEAAGQDLEELDIEKYAKLVFEANGITGEPKQDADGNYYMTYDREDGSGNTFSYYVTPRLGSGGGWVVTMACFKDAAETKLTEFIDYGRLITVE